MINTLSSGSLDEELSMGPGMAIADFTVKFNGIILKKAEFEGEFDSVYTKVFERLAQFQALGGNDVVEILGEMGG